MRISAYAGSDVGRLREGNEDSCYAGSTVFAVADGMGGHQAGEVASETALGPIGDLDDREFASGEAAQRALVDAIVDANRIVVAKAVAEPSFRGMGTTLTAVLLRDGRLHIAHVGDSRAYLLRGNRDMSQLTTDHTLVEQLIREGRLSRPEAAVHPQRSVITRAIGVDASVEVDSLPPLELQPGDQVLLCSDGLTGPVDDHHIAEILVDEADGDAACRRLIAAANDAGGPDNITVVLLRAEGDPATVARGVLPGTRAASLVPDATEELSTPAAAGAVAAARHGDGAAFQGEAVPIRTRDDSANANGGNFADAMRRFGDQQGIRRRARPDEREPGHRRLLAVLLAAVLLLGLAAGGSWFALQRAFFLGTHDGNVAIYRGLPQDLVGLRLHSLVETTDVAVRELPPRIQDRLAEGLAVGSLREATLLVDNYREDLAAAERQRRQEEREAAATPSPQPSPPGATAAPIP